MEMIDLRKGDILQFRIEDDLKNDRKRSDNLAGCSPSQYSPIQTLPTSPEPQSQHQLEQDCWSAPACPNDSPDSFEIGEGDEEYSKDLKMLSSEKQDLNYRKESSWSAPGQFNSEMIEIPLQNEKKEDKLEAEKLRKKNIFTGNENNDLIPMADDDGSNTPNYASLHGGYLTLPPGFKCHSAVDNSSNLIINTYSRT
ncbi:unnamed protein product [Meloidogyne enterolobii]|uniref:Uncharacterized protein n=1 Tax=Meloidogyne enterolobii TaxID=390850 RepID=A0ACB1A3G8_MELEN